VFDGHTSEAADGAVTFAAVMATAKSANKGKSLLFIGNFQQIPKEQYKKARQGARAPA
jgi:hypothetical protein